MRNIAVITESKSDFSRLLESVPGTQVQYMKPGTLSDYDLDLYEAFCILGGVCDTPIVLSADERTMVEHERAEGKRVFAEFCISIGDVYCADPAETQFKRLVFLGDNLGSLNRNDILDDQCNSSVANYVRPKGSRPVLVYKEYLVDGYSSAALSQKEKDSFADWALWFMTPETLVCNFRFCNGIRARFSPVVKWRELFTAAVRWITGETSCEPEFPSAYHLDVRLGGASPEALGACVSAGISWFENAGILLRNGKGGVLEGLHSKIYPDGSQKYATAIRTDCSGETSLAFLSCYLLTRNPVFREKMDHLQRFCMETMQVKGGMFKGMLRWTNSAWEVCYQDDASRAIIPVLLKFLYTGDAAYMGSAVQALNFLADVTGTDGTRATRIDTIALDEASLGELSQKPGNYPSAHYNAYYSAALLLGYRLTGIERFKEIGVKGLSTIMSAYPDTLREHSETQELCRLIMPLSWLYWVTGEERHRQWLYRVTHDLQKFRHKSGVYTEWDTGYQASCSHHFHSECSLLIRNGDPVVDLLYSVNWLPMAFSQAYLVTGDSRFLGLWKEISAFFVTSQIHSDNPLIDGAWARGFDADLWEYSGIPYDVGWGPWAIESGWTVAEILSGLALGMGMDALRPSYADPPKFRPASGRGERR